MKKPARTLSAKRTIFGLENSVGKLGKIFMMTSATNTWFVAEQYSLLSKLAVARTNRTCRHLGRGVNQQDRQLEPWRKGLYQ